MLQGKDVKHLEIPLIDIKTATKNFSKAYLIGSGTYGDVYKAEIDHFDSKNFLSLEQKIDNGERPKKRSTAAIKLIKIRQDQQGEEGFHAEIEMLTSFVLFEMLSGRLANDPIYINENENGIAHVARRRFNDRTIKDMEGNLEHLKIPLSEILSATENFAKTYLIRSGIHGEMYKAEVDHFDSASYLSFEKKYQVCLDSEHDDTGELKYDTDIYSFGVVLFEIMSGRFAHDPIYTKENSEGIVPIACRRFNDGTIREMVDPILMEETHVNTLYKGPGEDSLDAFSKIAYQCVTEHPVVEVILKKLEEALYFQENIKDHLKYPLEYILLATQNFSHNNLIGEGGFGSVYLGEVTSTHGDEYNTKTVAVKRLDRRYYEGDDGFLEELQTLFEYKHENIIGIVGYCVEKGENIIVYEYAPRGRLDKYLKDSGVTWMRRLQICIDIATGLDFLHGGGVTQEVVIHKDMKTYNVLLDDNWKAKVSAFGLSLIRTVLNKETDSSYGSLVTGTVGYVDPLYKTTGIFTKESDIYSFGVVLFQILSGRFVIEQQQDLTRFFKCHYEEDKVDEIVFEGIKEQIAPKSLNTFVTIAYQCLHHAREDRPTTSEVLLRLKEALEFQEDYEMWEPKLPSDYKEIIGMSNSREIYSTVKKKYLYDILSKGIILQEGKVLFSLGSNGENNEMISARKFSYKNRWSYKWRSIPKSRFHKVAKMLNISNLNIQVKTKPQFLSPGLNYGVNLVFRFCDPRKSLAKRMYVNLKYKKGNETLHAYFATWRDDGWMMIELCRFLNYKEDTDFEFLLESFSVCYCECRDIYIEGIEFRAIDNVQQLLMKSDLSVEHVQRDSQLILKTMTRAESYSC
ncbi:hypothetical protein L2E82_27973 [Cichorium intybus]|uniref:Uncharacterized protein n=1 Tax=Cichorium intybus TaxID=13427 RepID=A0ACB9CUJ7_CICIN|nr:hypothetical protein L2E82_27973 [Cichorium intybus]